MSLPSFPIGADPGPSFYELLQRSGVGPEPLARAVAEAASGATDVAGRLGAVTHATTIVALRYADGVIMAGDRRATAGNVIAHRNMDKVFPADRWSGVSISGVAGVAAEMVKLFQLELEHYEKVEGVTLSLEGKA